MTCLYTASWDVAFFISLITPPRTPKVKTRPTMELLFSEDFRFIYVSLMTSSLRIRSC